MTTFRTLAGWLLALLAAAGLHMLAFQLFAQPKDPVRQVGGRVQLQLGLDQAAERRAPQPSDPVVDAEPETVDAVEPEPAPETAPDTQPPQTDALIPEPEPAPEPEPEPDPEPQPRPAPEPEPATEPPAEPPAEPQAEPERRSQREAAEPSEATAEPEEAEAPSVDAEAGPRQDEEGPQARQGEEDAPDVERQAGDAESENYAGAVLRHLSQVRRPRASGPGTARVAFTVARDGSLERVEIAQSSGSGRFDRDAVRMIERAAPFPEPPAGVNREFTVEIEGR